MTPNDYINKAIHAIETDQPNLAMLYMRRGIREMKRLRPDPWEGVREAVGLFTDALTQMVTAYANFGVALVEAFQPIVEQYQEAFALVADNE